VYTYECTCTVKLYLVTVSLVPYIVVLLGTGRKMRPVDCNENITETIHLILCYTFVSRRVASNEQILMKTRVR